MCNNNIKYTLINLSNKINASILFANSYVSVKDYSNDFPSLKNGLYYVKRNAFFTIIFKKSLKSSIENKVSCILYVAGHPINIFKNLNINVVHRCKS